VFSRTPGDIARAGVLGESGLVFGPRFTAGNAERFPSTDLDLENRARGQRLWFYGPGWIEYEFDVGKLDPDSVAVVEFKAELASCARPGNTHYAVPGNASRVQVTVAGLDIGHVDVVGDPGVDGFLQRLRVTDAGTFWREQRVSQINLTDLLPRLTGTVSVRLTVRGLSGNRGGLNVHGPNGSGVHGCDPALVVYTESR